MATSTEKKEEIELRTKLIAQSAAAINENEQVIEAIPPPLSKTLEQFIEQEARFTLTKCRRYERNCLEASERYQCTKIYKETDCKCGKPLSAHPPEAFSAETATGPRTIDVPCNSYGEMRFVDPKRRIKVHGSTAKYIRLKGCTDDDYLENVCELLMNANYWSLDPPQLIIEVTGTALEFTGINERLTEKFHHGLIKAAESGDAWLITGGSHTGVMKLVGNAAAKARRLNIPLTCLGIASWGIITNREQLEKTPRETNNQPVDYYIDQRGSASLNYGHNYYLLVDNGVEERFGEEIAFRAALMHFLSQRAQVFEEREQKQENSNQNVETTVKATTAVGRPYQQREHQRLLSIPRVLLVVGGGINTLRTCKLAVEGTPEHPDAVSPVVALAGFGGASDLIAHAHAFLQSRPMKKFAEKAETNDKEPPREFFMEMCRHPSFSAFAKLTGADTAEEEEKKWVVVRDVYSLFQNRKMITVVDLRNPREITLDKAILNAIFKAECFRDKACYRMLDLARRWDLSNVAKDIIEKYHSDMNNLEQSRMDSLLSLSIVGGQSEFYELFTNYRLVHLDIYLTQHKIQQLYMQLISKLDQSEEEVRQPKKLQLLRCVQLFTTVLTSRSKNAQQCDVSLLNVGDFLADKMGCYLSNPFAIRAGSEAVKAMMEQNCYVWAIRDLFVMQLLLNQDKFALQLWRDGRDHIGTALLASIFLNELSEEAKRNDMISLVEPYRKQSEVWLSRAVEVLTRCNEARPECTPELLTRVLPTWQNRTVLELAYYGKMRRFIQEPSVLTKLGQVWHGRIASFIPAHLIFLTSIFPMFAFGLYFEIDKSAAKCSHHSDSIEFVGAGVRSDGDVKLRAVSSSLLNPQIKRTVLVKPSLVTRHCCSRSGNSDRLSFPRALFYLYTTPMVKYFFHTAALLGFLLLFSSFILKTSLHPEGATKVEIAIVIWSLCLLCDGFHESFGLDLTVFLEQNSSDSRAYFTETWHRLVHGCYNAILFDMLAEIILLTSFILRHTLTVEYFVYPQTLYAIACLFFWIKSFRVLYLTKSIGLLAVTLGKILPILLQFLLLYIVIIVTFAPPLFALANPQWTTSNNEDPDFFPLLLDVIYRRWWNLVGVAIDTTRARIEETCPLSYASNAATAVKSAAAFNSNNFPQNSTAEAWVTQIEATKPQRCESGGSILGRNFVAAILFVTYLWLTNITWLNMLIASLNHAVEKTRASAIEYWSFNYYIAVRTWYHRCVLPAPLSFIELVVRFAIYLWSQGENRDSPMRRYASDIENLRWDELERSAVDQMLDDEEHPNKPNKN